MMPDKIDISTASAASAAATSPVWLPTAEKTVSVAADPIWAELLAPLGVLWLIIQIGYFLYDRYQKRQSEGANDGE